MNASFQRRKRATILESEGIRESQINKAEGTKQAAILASEGFKLEQINNANGEAEALRAKANARAQALKIVSDQLTSEVTLIELRSRGRQCDLKSFQEGRNAASLQIAEQYVHAFGNLARTNNTILLPTNTGDMSSMVASALSIFKNLQSTDQKNLLPPSSARSSSHAVDSVSPSADAKATNDASFVQRTKKSTKDKDTQ